MSGSPGDPKNDEHHGHNHEGADHDHSHDHDHDVDAEFDELTILLVAAQGGLRSDVQELIDAADELSVFIPLSEDIEGTEDGKDFEVPDSLSFRPHMLLDSNELPFAVAYSDPSLSEELAEELEWKTSGGELKFVRVPFQVALELAQEVVEGKSVQGLVFNPSSDAELVLSREETTHIARGQAIPLVGYVGELAQDDEGTMVIEDADPPPQALLDVLAAATRSIEGLVETVVKTTFNPERDREPHLTITLVLASDTIERGEVAERVMADASAHLPAPGYADVIFQLKG